MKFFETSNRRKFLKNGLVLGTAPLLPKPFFDAATNTFTAAHQMEENFTFFVPGRFNYRW